MLVYARKKDQTLIIDGFLLTVLAVDSKETTAQLHVIVPDGRSLSRRGSPREVFEERELELMHLPQKLGLVVPCSRDDTFVIDGTLEIVIVDIRARRVRIGTEAPPDTEVRRFEAAPH